MPPRMPCWAVAATALLVLAAAGALLAADTRVSERSTFDATKPPRDGLRARVSAVVQAPVDDSSASSARDPSHAHAGGETAVAVAASAPAASLTAASAPASLAASASSSLAASASASLAARMSTSAAAAAAAPLSGGGGGGSSGAGVPTNHAEGAVAQALKRQRRSNATFEPLPVGPSAGALAPAELPFLDACVDGLGFHVKEDTLCYEQMAERTTLALARDPHAPYCWGYSGRASAAEPLLFHTLVLNGVGSQTPLLLWSFLATQCCDAVLWFWLAPEAARNMGAPPIALPPELAHRVVFKPFDAAAEWAPVAADFPAANETSLAALNGFTDIRFTSDWARQLLMYRYGGLWVDIDTVFLQDVRPLFAFTPFAYRAGFNININNALMRLGKAPNPVTHEIMAAAIAAVDPRPDAIFATLGVKRMGTPAHFHYLRQTLFDFMWLRFLRETTEGLNRAQPECTNDHWNCFFAPASSDEELQRWRATAYLPGSYTYHWHNRYQRGLPERAWAGVLAARFEELARAKVRVCEPRP